MVISTGVRDGPFNFQGGGGILIPNVAEKDILILVEEKNNILIQFLSYNLMLISGKKICAMRDENNQYSNSRVVRKTNSERNKKPYPPPAS